MRLEQHKGTKAHDPQYNVDSQSRNTPYNPSPANRTISYSTRTDQLSGVSAYTSSMSVPPSQQSARAPMRSKMPTRSNTLESTHNELGVIDKLVSSDNVIRKPLNSPGLPPEPDSSPRRQFFSANGPDIQERSPSPTPLPSDDDFAQTSTTSHTTASTTSKPSSIPIPQTPTTMICAACHQQMTGQFVKALGAIYHLDCFRCGDCNTVVAQKFFPIEGKDGAQHPLCETDYFRRLNLICAKCGSALRGSYITACNKKYHVEHFSCSICPTLFGQQDSYYEHENNVYCHLHYSTRFATKCIGCNSAILKQFVEINRNQKDECWHPECYMIHKFWNVKVRPSTTSTSDTDMTEQSLEDAYQEEESRETAASLKEKQTQMEQQVYRIWTVLSAFEESSAACISDMLRLVSNGQYLEAIRMADKFILHVEVLFATIDDLELYFSQRNAKGMSHVREARMLCRKTVDLFTLLSRTQESESRRTGMTQELLALVTGLAHYLKILIRIALTGGLKLEREHQEREPMNALLEKLHMLAARGGNPSARRLIKNMNDVTGTPGGTPGTQGVSYGYKSLAPENAGDSPFWPRDAQANLAANSAPSSSSAVTAPNPPSDLCMVCNLTVEEDCVRLGTYQRWHSYCVKCVTCGKMAAPPNVKDPPKPSSSDGKEGKDKDEMKDPPPKVTTARRPPANVDEFVYEESQHEKRTSFVIYCTSHSQTGSRGAFKAVSKLEQYAFLLNVALRRLYVMLKQRGVIQVSSDPLRPSPTSRASFASDSSDLLAVKSVHLDRKLSATARMPQRSTIVESPSGRTVQPTTFTNYQRPPDNTSQQSRPPRAVASTSQQPSPPPQIHAPSAEGSPTSPTERVIRPDFARNNTRVKIVDDEQYELDASELSRSSDDGLTLADIPQLVEAEQAREQRRSMPHQVDRPLLADLSTLELAIVKHCAVLALYKSPLRDQFELEEILELVEVKKSGFWKQLFKGTGEKNKHVKKKGVFGVPLELLVEKDGFDSTLGISRTPLRVPSFIDDVISAMRQMDMSVEGIFRKNGNIRRLKDLSDSIDRDPSAVDLTSDNPVQLAALLKKFLRELPDPLFTFKLHRLFVASQSSPDPDERKRLLHMVSIILPKCNQDTMQVLFVFLKWVASFAHVDEAGNKMDLQNLSTVLAPNVLYAKRDPAREESFGSIRVVTEILETQDELYLVPEEFMEILHDQEYFAGALDLPSKEFLKKCDTYMKLRNNSGRPAFSSLASGLLSPALNGSHNPLHPHGSPFTLTSNPSSGVSTPRTDDNDIRLVPQRSDPALSRGRTTVSDGHGQQQHRNNSPRRKQARDSRSLERGMSDNSSRNKLSATHPGLPHQSHSQASYLASPPDMTSLSQDIVGSIPNRLRMQDLDQVNPPLGQGEPRASGEYYNYSPNSEHSSHTHAPNLTARPR